MNVEDHRNKARRMGAVRDKLDPLEDYELWYWASLGAGMNLFNGALHHLGVTVAEDCFAHNLPVYIRAGATPGTFEPVLRPSGDLEHVDGDDDGLIPPQLDAAAEALRRLEAVRDGGVRGDLEISADMVSRVEADYRRCLTCAERVLNGAP